MIVVSFALLELMSIVGLLLLEIIKPALFAHALADQQFESLNDKKIDRYFAEAYDEELGWDNQPFHKSNGLNVSGQRWTKSFAADGSRVDPFAQGDLLISTYGDSFTLCAEVNDGQTWQSILGRMLGGIVKNYGVEGYGTGQAVLKFKKHITSRLVAPITILGIYEENIGRLSNNYRLFYQVKTKSLLFKPWFSLGTDGRVLYHPNPINDRTASWAELRALAKDLAPLDFWGARMFFVRFPSSFEWLRVLRLRLDGLQPGRERGLWDRDEGRRVMVHIVDSFRHAADIAGSKPIILFIPDGHSSEHLIPPGYTPLKKTLRAQGVIVIDVHEQAFDRRQFNILPFQGHASEYGNRVIAQAIERTLRRAGLVVH
jgi:hypothetical protein